MNDEIKMKINDIVVDAMKLQKYIVNENHSFIRKYNIKLLDVLIADLQNLKYLLESLE